MRYFANPSTEAIRAHMVAGRLGCIITPAQGNRVPAGATWCADNGLGPARNGKPGRAATLPPAEHDPAWFEWLRGRVASEGAATCAFAVAPDVVGDAAATITRARPWLNRVRELGVPVAFVAQDGQEDLPVPWDADVLFIGGSTDWKLGPHARGLVAAALSLGKWVHMGRVNTGRRYRYAAGIGCHSADGTTLAQFPDATLPDVLGWTGQPAMLTL